MRRNISQIRGARWVFGRFHKRRVQTTKAHKFLQYRNVSSELYNVFSVEDSKESKDHKKKTAEEKKFDKEEERKVRRYTKPAIAM